MSLQLNELGRTCLSRERVVGTGPDDKVYQVVKLAMVIDALAAEGISIEDALAGVGITRNAMSSPATRVSLNQIIECYRNANKLTHDPHFAYNAGRRFHVTRLWDVWFRHPQQHELSPNYAIRDAVPSARGTTRRN
jgi:hypothetical protein